MELGSEVPINDAFLKILPRDCSCREVSKCSAFECLTDPTDSVISDAIGRLADALVRVPGRYNVGERYEENGRVWWGSTPGIAHGNKNAVGIRFLILYRGHLEEQADGTEKVVGGNCGINLLEVKHFLNAFDKAKKNKDKLTFLFKETFEILVKGFSPCSFTVHTAQEGVLRILAKNICGKWPFDSVEPSSFSCFEMVRQKLCQQAHIKYWDARPKSEGGWGVWVVDVRGKRAA